VSVVAPVYNERACLGELVHRLDAVLRNRTYEIVLVDDGSRDGSWDEIVRLGGLYPAVKGLRFSRNFGHHVAITAGLDWACGEWVVVMDSDLQDLPESIPLLLDKTNEGFDMVVARRQGKRHGAFKRATSRLFARTMTWLADFEFDESVGVFRVMHRRVVTSVRAMRETPRVFTAMTDWVGFRRGSVDVPHGARFAGETKYPLRKQLVLALRAALGFSEKPLQIAVYSGLVIAAAGLGYAGYIVLRALSGGIAVSGYASLMSAVLTIGGLGIATTGLVGLYVGSIFTHVKGRPLYILAASQGLAAGVLPPDWEDGPGRLA
jgi:dolichol-phosphate mannosyltransferase